MTPEYDLRELSSREHPYFFLSYAHSPTVDEGSDTDPDPWVKRFFGDLVTAVRHASPLAERINGFMDQHVPPGSDKESLHLALSTAQVFVPLYSVGYLNRSLPGREWACFRRRIELVGLTRPEQRFVPVLWAPLSRDQDAPGLLEALALGADEPGYAENGLRALLKISSYRSSYRAVVNVMARQIVTLAENAPIEPSEAPDIDEMPSAFSGPPLSVFTVEVAAPTTSTVPVGRDPGGYGQSSLDWRPFPGQKLPLAEYARQAVERRDFKAEVSGLKVTEEPNPRRPGIMLIDPWFIAGQTGRSTLESAVRDLPRWVMPLLILPDPDDGRAAALADQVRDILRAAHALPTDSSRRGARGVSSLDGFNYLISVLVGDAERQYVRYRSGKVSSQRASGRHSLSHHPQPYQSDSAQNSLGETPDA